MPRRLATLLALLLVACSGTITPASPIDTPVPNTPTPTEVSTPTEPALPLQFTFNGGFEQDCLEGVVHIADGVYRDNVCSPRGWVTWWRQGSGEGGEWGQPEVKLLEGDDPLCGYGAELPRLCEGDHSVQLFTMYRPHDAGFYTIVAGLPAGTRVRFSAQAMGWTCNTDENIGYTCENDWDQVYFRVGVDPYGYTNPMGWSVIWSESTISPDAFGEVGPVEVLVGDRGIVAAFRQ